MYEVEQLRKQVQTTLNMYKQACKELVHKQTQVGVTVQKNLVFGFLNLS